MVWEKILIPGAVPCPASVSWGTGPCLSRPTAACVSTLDLLGTVAQDGWKRCRESRGLQKLSGSGAGKGVPRGTQRVAWQGQAPRLQGSVGWRRSPTAGAQSRCPTAEPARTNPRREANGGRTWSWGMWLREEPAWCPAGSSAVSQIPPKPFQPVPRLFLIKSRLEASAVQILAESTLQRAMGGQEGPCTGHGGFQHPCSRSEPLVRGAEAAGAAPIRSCPRGATLGSPARLRAPAECCPGAKGLGAVRSSSAKVENLAVGQ